MTQKDCCELCGSEDGKYHVGGACRYICDSCEQIVIKWEEKRKIYYDNLILMSRKNEIRAENYRRLVTDAIRLREWNE